MTRLFVQLLLSVIVGVSAGLSLKANTKAELRQILQEAGTALRETAKGTVQSIGDMAARVDVAISAKVDNEASSETLAKTEIKVKSNVDVNAGNGFSIPDAFLPDFSLDDTFDYESRTDAESDLPGQDVELTEKYKSSLNLNLDAGE